MQYTNYAYGILWSLKRSLDVVEEPDASVSSLITGTNMQHH